MKFTVLLSAVALLAHSACAIKPSATLVRAVSASSQANSSELWSSGTSISPPYLVKSMSPVSPQDGAQKPFVATEASSETSVVPSPASSTVSLATTSASAEGVPAADVEAETEQVTATGGSAEASSSSSTGSSGSAVSTAGANDEYRKQAMAPMAAAAIALVGAVAAL